MKRLMALALAIAPLSGCAGLAGMMAPAPAPLAHTAIDEQALNVAYEAYDAVLTAVDSLVAAHYLVPNTPKALRVQRYLITARDALNAATSAARAGNAQSYADALRNAQAAFTSARNAIQES